MTEMPTPFVIVWALASLAAAVQLVALKGWK